MNNRQPEGHSIDWRGKLFKLHGTVRPPVGPDGEEDAEPGQDDDVHDQGEVLEETLSIWSTLGEGNDQDDVLELGNVEDGKVLVGSYWIIFWITPRFIQMLAMKVCLGRGVDVARIFVVKFHKPRLGPD